MGLEDMLKKIDEEARSEADAIMDKARKEAETTRGQKSSEVTAEIREMEEKLEKEISSIRNVHISDGRRRSRQVLLSAKEELILESLSEIRRRLSSMVGTELDLFLLPLYEKALSILGSDMKVYPIREADRSALVQKGEVELIIEGNEDLPSSISRFKGKELLGGFIATTSDGSRVVNMSFLGILEKEEDRIREIIASTLFKE